MKYLLLLAVTAILPAQTFDILIRNGRIVDGTGNPSWVGDVGIRQGRIAAIGRLAGSSAQTTIDARGLVVAPGFIDIHNHSDYTLLQDGNAESMIRQGVTSMILGEGGSAAVIQVPGSPDGFAARSRSKAAVQRDRPRRLPFGLRSKD